MRDNNNPAPQTHLRGDDRTDEMRIADAIYDVMSIDDGVTMTVAERYAKEKLAALATTEGQP